MSTPSVHPAPEMPATLSAQAAAWISRLNADDRTPAVDAACREWLDADPRHRAAFDIANRMWESAATLPVSMAARIGSRSRVTRKSFHQPVRWLVAAGAAVAGIACVMLYAHRAQTIETRTGQQLTLPLEDGSRLTLNTDTRVRVRFDEGARRVDLESGEALFDVARDGRRPFTVLAGDREIRALGTQFIVRHDAKQTAVTLVEGKISVDASSSKSAAAEASTILAPGQRITLAQRLPAVLDTPSIDAITAWRRGQIVFENTPLSVAIEEMNRYSTHKLALGDAATGQVPVSGLFRSGDTENFVLALTHTHALAVREHDGEILIERDSK